MVISFAIYFLDHESCPFSGEMKLERFMLGGEDAGRVIFTEEYVVAYGLHWADFVNVEWKFIKQVLVPLMARTINNLELPINEKKPALCRLVMQLWTELSSMQGRELLPLHAWSFSAYCTFNSVVTRDRFC